MSESWQPISTMVQPFCPKSLPCITRHPFNLFDSEFCIRVPPESMSAVRVAERIILSEEQEAGMSEGRVYQGKWIGKLLLVYSDFD